MIARNDAPQPYFTTWTIAQLVAECERLGFDAGRWSGGPCLGCERPRPTRAAVTAFAKAHPELWDRLSTNRANVYAYHCHRSIGGYIGGSSACTAAERAAELDHYGLPPEPPKRPRRRLRLVRGGLQP